MNGSPVLVSGLAEIAGDYDAIICDVWGVVHDGVRAYGPAVEALAKFRKNHGSVVLLTNAPRPPSEIAISLKGYGVPEGTYDIIVSSGGAAREELVRRAHGARLKMMHIGPERDTPVFNDLDIELVGADKAEVVLCTGLFDDDHETPDDYAATLAEMKRHDLTMICANPDLLAPRAGVLVHCAGGIARAYEKIGGEVIYYGKPKPAIYEETIMAAGGRNRHILVIGDALETDMAGANVMGLDALFVANGLHKDELGAVTNENLAALFAKHNLKARAAVDILKW
ncbi:TIGR01459 family HAD-type hydrolase [Rhizomicrobium electricum]|uniref:TIGR01459 family HAD-type hydrolase n=1 Tax=Rhizomicrobium electricum TaxID=480070 RepID=A0ABP3PP55_9PROT|nr:TIGR01459 family HAD-type hydrolase [Rhizomicrobium electricum]NIJ47084.1 HAD superfamily hydrolase (TIGR01459 family) [Rhizomicrobium electricum]